MSTPAEVLLALQAQLQASEHLSYIEDEQILIGEREGFSEFPSICLMEEDTDEQAFVYPTVDIRLTVQMAVLVKNEDKDEQIVGGSTIKGTKEIENDIKLAIDADPTLGGEVIFTEFLNSTDGPGEPPVRRQNVRLSVWFRQVRGTRT